jgi:signal transduction histidine kinase
VETHLILEEEVTGVEEQSSARGRTLVRRDLAVALLVAVLLEVGLEVALTEDFPEYEEDLPLPDWQGRLLLLGGGLTLAFRRLAPVPVFAIAGLASFGYQALGFRPPPLPLAVLVALFTVAIVRRPLVAGMATGTYAAGLVVGSLTGAAPLDDDQVYVYLVSVAGTAMVGYGVALSRARARLAEQQASDISRQLEVRTREAVEGEQARIAREVHDIVAHDISVIVAQAGAARRVSGDEPGAAVNALASIEAVGRDALDGLRRLMHLLRSDPLGRPDHSPEATIDRLPVLLAQVEKAGLPVDMTIRGEVRPLPATVEFHAFRIIQEALTNSLKHAGPTRAGVVVEYRPNTLYVEVHDHGRGRAEEGPPGYGLAGMQQRASLLGGELATTTGAETGFRVAVELPMGAGGR